MWQQLVDSKDQLLDAVGIRSSKNKHKRRKLPYYKHSSSSSSWSFNHHHPSSNSLQQNQPPPPCSDLYDLVLGFHWPAVIRHCQLHPQDAQFQEWDTQETSLYLACQWNPPLEVIQALIQAHPEALQITSREHRDLPVHVLCRSAATSVEILEQVVQRYPSTVQHPTKHGQTALQVLWGHGRPLCMKQNTHPSSEEEQEQVDQFWIKVKLLVTAVAQHRQQAWPLTSRGQELHLVHAVVSLGALGCPLPVLEYICDQYPHQLQQRDGTGRLPLHLAVGPTQWSPSTKRKYKPREQAIIVVLLKRYPQAARVRWFSMWDYYDTETMNNSSSSGSSSSSSSRTNKGSSNNNRRIPMDRRGRYPLHMAVANRHTWDGGVQELFLAAPELLSIRDPVTQLYPFQLAAIPVGDTVVVNATTVWELLRLQPELLMNDDRVVEYDEDDDGNSTSGTTERNATMESEQDEGTKQSQSEILSEGRCCLLCNNNTITKNDCGFYAPAKKRRRHSKDNSNNTTLLFGLGVAAIAVGAGFWCWNSQQPQKDTVSSSMSLSRSSSRSQSSLS